jgi:prevent-host-death family protein
MTTILIMPRAKKAPPKPPVRKKLAAPPKPDTGRQQVKAARQQVKAARQTVKRATRPEAPRIDELAPTQPLATVKARFSEMVERVSAYRDRITVTKNGVPVAVLLSADDFESLVETIEILSDAEAMAEIAQGRADIERGDVVTGEELARRYGVAHR